MIPAHNPCCGAEAVSLVSSSFAVCRHWPQYNSCYGCQGSARELHGREPHTTSPGCRHQERAEAKQLLLRSVQSQLLPCAQDSSLPLGWNPDSERRAGEAACEHATVLHGVQLGA